jgi:hypothetical protein
MITLICMILLILLFLGEMLIFLAGFLSLERLSIGKRQNQ